VVTALKGFGHRLTSIQDESHVKIYDRISHYPIVEISSFVLPVSWVFGPNIGCNLFLTLQLEAALHFIPVISQSPHQNG
jgi:hypothetical protein